MMPVGEYDRRLVILTRERGKISVFAKGARRQSSPLIACSQPFVFGDFFLYQGRNSYTLYGAEIKNYFQELRGDVELTFHGLYFCEVMDYLTSEGNDELDFLRLLYQSLRALSHPRIGAKLARVVFDWKSFYLNGEGPCVGRCAFCGKDANEIMENAPDGKVLFRVKAGGIVCEECAAMPEKNRFGEAGCRLSPGAWYALNFIGGTPIDKLFTFVLKDEVQKELASLFCAYRKEYMPHRFSSLELLETL